MQPVDAVKEQVAALVGGVFDAGLVDVVGVAFEGFQFREQAIGDSCAAHRDESLDLLHVGDGHDAGHDRDGDADVTTVVAEAKEVGVIEEELRDDRACAGVDFAFEMFEIASEVEALWMTFGEPRASDEGLGDRSDVGNELVGVLESAGRTCPCASAGRIAAEGQNVVHVLGGELLDDRSDLVGGVSDASQVGENVDPDVVLNPAREFDGLGPRASARAIGDADVAGVEGFESVDGLIKACPPFIGLGRKELKTDRGPPRGECLVESHNQDNTSPKRTRPAQSIRSSGWTDGKFGAGRPA